MSYGDTIRAPEENIDDVQNPIQEQNDASKLRRILSIDGGGVLGTFPASFLAELEEKIDNPIGSYFDLIVGTSTGGIIAIALGLGHKASEILELYEQHGPRIFGGSRLTRGALHLIRHKFGPKLLRKALEDTFGEKKIGDSKTRLVIPAWSPIAQSVYLYKTAHHSSLTTDYRSLAVDAAMATTAAPTFFPHHITRQGIQLLDGGVWANNPTSIAAVEAIALLGWPSTSIRILSIGCLNEPYTIPRFAGIFSLRHAAIKLFMDGQSLSSNGMAKLLVGDAHCRKSLYRINHTAPPKEYKLDDPKAIPKLKDLGHFYARSKSPELLSAFFDTPAEKFEPVTTKGENLAN